MSDKKRLSIAAGVTANERAAVQVAADHLARVLGEADGKTWTCETTFADDPAALASGEGADLLVTSLLTEVARSTGPWAETEKRLRKLYAQLTESGTPVFICTVLRRAGDHDDALLVRIRRLNLLAADLSRETGAYVIDVDRVLADIGGRWLQTDYRLGGPSAAAVAGHLIAQTLLNNAIDAHVPFEVQEAAQALLEKARPSVTQGDTRSLHMVQKFQPVKTGRRTQTVIPVVYTDRDVAAGLLLDQAIRGKMRPGELYTHLREAIANHGVRGTVAIASSLVARKFRKK
jgi:hypothetical protein